MRQLRLATVWTGVGVLLGGWVLGPVPELMVVGSLVLLIGACQ